MNIYISNYNLVSCFGPCETSSTEILKRRELQTATKEVRFSLAIPTSKLGQRGIAIWETSKRTFKLSFSKFSRLVESRFEDRLLAV